LAVSWADTLYIHFWGCCPITEFCQVQNSLCVQVLHSPILAALLDGTQAVGVSQTSQRGTRNGITELSQRVPPIFGWADITLGIGPHSSFLYFSYCYLLPLWWNKDAYICNDWYVCVRACVCVCVSGLCFQQLYQILLVVWFSSKNDYC